MKQRNLPSGQIWCRGRFAAAMIFGLLLVFGTPPPAAAKERVLELEFPAKEIQGVVLEGGNGSVRVVVGERDTIRVRVEVRPEKWPDREPVQGFMQWFLVSAFDDLDDLMAALRLEVDSTRKGHLKLELSPSRHTRDARVLEDWQVTVPKRLSAQVAMARADIEVRDVAGGVDISVANGSVEVDVPKGDLDVEMAIGKAQVRTRSTSVGVLDLRARVGDTDLWMNGAKVKYPDPPGPGSRIGISGKGKDAIRMSIEVGDASLRVNTP